MYRYLLIILLLLLFSITVLGGSTDLSDHLQFTGYESVISDGFYNVDVSKKITSDGEIFEFKYIIKTPQVDDLEFVLALDSSGSLSEMEEVVIAAVPEFIHNLASMFPDKNVKLSILSWDDDIDFAYGDFNNKNPADAWLVPIRWVEEDIRNNHVFINENCIGDYYECNPHESTNLSLAIDASINIFENNPITDYTRTSRSIILVVGGGEFEACSMELIEKARMANYPIFVIGINVLSGSELSDHLEILGNNTPGRIRFILPTQRQLVATLNEFMYNMVESPTVGNVTITESLPSYIRPNKMAKVKTIGNAEQYEIENVIYDWSDGTTIGITTIEINIPFELSPNEITEVSFYSDLKTTELLKLNPKYPKFLIIPESRPNSFRYTWLNGGVVMLSLPENQIELESISLSSKDKALSRLLYI